MTEFRGPMVGGPWGGVEHSAELEVCSLYSAESPEGAIYRWHAESAEWRYEGKPAPNAFSALLGALGMLGGRGED